MWCKSHPEYTRDKSRRHTEKKRLAYLILKEMGVKLDHLSTMQQKERVSLKVLQQHFPEVLPTTPPQKGSNQ
jgi:hypothetical protein